MGIVPGLWAAEASAATVRTEVSPKLGAEVMLLEGRIDRGDLAKVQAALRVIMAKQPDGDRLIALHSPGGNVDEAVRIARFLKQNGVGTVLLPSTVCASACAFVFFGGTDPQSGQPWRLAFAGSQLAVHSSRLVERPGRSQATIADANTMLAVIQRQVANLLTFFNEVRISPQLQSKILETPNADVYVLTERDKAANGIATLRSRAGRWSADGAAVRLPRGLAPVIAEAPRPAPPAAPPAAPAAAGSPEGAALLPLSHSMRPSEDWVAAPGSGREPARIAGAPRPAPLPAPGSAAAPSPAASRAPPALLPLSHSMSPSEDRVEAPPPSPFPVQTVFNAPAAAPRDAPGVLLWNPGSPGPDVRPAPVAPYLRLFHRAGWSVLRLDRTQPGDPQEDGIRAIVGEAERLKQAGYRRVVLAGQSRGAWLALAAAARSEAVYGVIATAPGGYGAETSLAVDRSAAELTTLLQAVRSARVALFLFEGDDREDVPGGRGAPSRRALEAQSRPFLVVDRPPGLRGHNAAMLGKFARLYGECLVALMTGNPPAGPGSCDLGSGLAAGSDVPMPPSSQEIAPALAGAPPEEQRLLGRWYGIWNDGAARILAVTQLGEGDAEVVYGSADSPAGPDPKARWWRARWRWDGAGLVHEAKDGVRRAVPRPDGQVLLTWTPAVGAPASLVMRRIDPSTGAGQRPE